MPRPGEDHSPAGPAQGGAPHRLGTDHMGIDGREPGFRYMSWRHEGVWDRYP